MRAEIAPTALERGEIQADNEDWTLHPVLDTMDRKRLARSANHIVRETEIARSWRGFPDGAVAIAANGSGDLLVVRAGSDQIERWDHETGALAPVLVHWD